MDEFDNTVRVDKVREAVQGMFDAMTEVLSINGQLRPSEVFTSVVNMYLHTLDINLQMDGKDAAMATHAEVMDMLSVETSKFFDGAVYVQAQLTPLEITTNN